MAKPLSQEEIDILLDVRSQLSGGDDYDVAHIESMVAADAGKRVNPYNFKRPRLFAQDQMRVLGHVHEAFARDLAVYLSAQLRTIVEINLSAIDQVLSSPGESAVQAQVIDAYRPELSLFAMLEGLPLAAITSTIGIILVIVFFVTSSDSGSLVIDTITAGGKVDAPITQRVFWCTFEGAVAIVLLLSVGGLASLQSMVISTGLPFAVVLLLLCVLPVGVAVQVVRIHVGEGSDLREQGERQVKAIEPIPAKRGAILDRAGRALVVNTSRYDLALDPTTSKEPSFNPSSTACRRSFDSEPW